MSPGQLAFMIDLRFKSKVTEVSFKKDNDESLLYKGLAAYSAWHSLLFVMVCVGPYDRFYLPHIGLLLLSGLLFALALLHIRTGWIKKLNWEVLFLVLGCSWELALPSIANSYLSQVPGHVGGLSFFQVLGYLSVVINTLVIPFRSCLSWMLLLCGIIATSIEFAQSAATDLDLTTRTMTHAVSIILCCVCWCEGWCSEKHSRSSWEATHQKAATPQSYSLAAVVPVETSDGSEAVDLPAQLLGSRQDEGFNGPSAICAMALEFFKDVGTKFSGGHALRIGANIPDFEMKTTQGDFSLHSFLSRRPDKPWTVLFSHPNDFTPVCTTELGACHASHAAFEGLGAQMIGLSCNTKESHQAWIMDVLANMGNRLDDDLAFPIIADVDMMIVNTLGMLDPDEKTNEGVPLPARGFIILYHTTVKLTSLYPASVGRSVDRMLKSLRLLQQSAAGALPPRPNPLRIGMIIPNFHITTTIGDLKFHTWLTSDIRRPWTVLVSHPTDFIFGGESDDDPRRKLITFASKMGCKFIGVSCDGNEVRHASSRDAMGNDDFPIILDPERCIMNYLGMLDIDVKDAAGFDVPARTFIILHGTTVRLSDMHQATVPRDFDEMLRVLSSFDLTSANHGLATPANWHTGDRVMVGPSVTTEEANANFLDLRIHALPSGKQYLRSVQCPPLPD